MRSSWVSGPQESREPARDTRAVRRRLSWREELFLAVLPTVTVLLVLALVEQFSHQRLLFASLASSALLIYLDPLHGMNSARTLVLAQMGAALVGFGAHLTLGTGYWAAAAAMVVTIVLMIGLDAVHPPAVATALSFAFRAGPESNLVLFGLAVGVIALLLLLERSSLWLLARISKQ
jgi:CBS-domain-containing membrane protein